MSRFQSIAGLGIETIQRNDRPASSSLLSGCTIPLVGQEVLERRQQKRAESTLSSIDGGQEVTSQQTGKKRLCQILGLMPVMPSLSQKGIQGIPVGTAQFCERFCRAR